MFDSIKRNPVLVAAVLVAALQVLEAEGVTWATFAISVIALITRQFTVPASEVEESPWP